MQKQASYLGYLYLFITFFCWGSIYVVSKYALAVMAPVMVSFFRYFISVVCLVVLVSFKHTELKPVARGDWKYLFILGGVGYFVSVVFMLLGTALLPASLSALINALNPVAIVLLAAMFLGEKITRKIVLSITVSLVGVYIIIGVNGSSFSFLGLVSALLSMLFWSMASVASRKLSYSYNTLQISLYGMLIALAMNLPAALVEHLFFKPSKFTLVSMAACVYLAVAGTAIAHSLWNKSLHLLPASTCSMFYPLQPLTATLLGVVFLGEALTWNFILGGTLICLGILITVVPTERLKSKFGW